MAKKLKKAHVGISITQLAIEVVAFSPKGGCVESAATIETPPGLLDESGDRILNPELLKATLSSLLKGLKTRAKTVNLSVPGTLLRMVDMPRLEAEQLYVSLSSEAERYKMFDGSDAVVDFTPVEHAKSQAPNMAPVLFGAIRQDTLDTYVRILKSLKLKVVTVDLEPMNVLRGMAGTGVLDALAQQVGESGEWGVIFVEPERVRISLWEGNRLLDFRETNMNTGEFMYAQEDSIVVEDMLEEIRRTTKHHQPLVWLTYNLPTGMEQMLSSRMGVPMRPCMVGQSLNTGDVPLTLPAIGSSLVSTVAFPAELNILVGIGRGGGASAEPESLQEGDSSTPAVAMVGGFLVLIICGLVSGALLLLNAVWSGPAADAKERELAAVETEVKRLTAEKQELLGAGELGNTIANVVQAARQKNRIYVHLTDDLQHKAPPRLWINEVSVDSRISFKGNALQHQDVIDFAKRFDGSRYIRNVKINEIQEQLLSGTEVFHYIIAGGINTDGVFDDEGGNRAAASLDGLEEPEDGPSQ